jgi:hypothetical protein
MGKAVRTFPLCLHGVDRDYFNYHGFGGSKIDKISPSFLTM